MAKHPGFAEKFAQIGVCEDIYGRGTCSAYMRDKLRFARPAPVGFLVCRAEPGGCDTQVFAPVYRNKEWGEFTGAEGGYLAQRHP